MKVSCFVVLQKEWQRIVPKLQPLLLLCVVQRMQKSLVCGAFCCVIVIAQASYSGSVGAGFSASASNYKEESLPFVFDCIRQTPFAFAANNCIKTKTAHAGFAERAENVGL